MKLQKYHFSMGGVVSKRDDGEYFKVADLEKVGRELLKGGVDTSDV